MKKIMLAALLTAVTTVTTVTAAAVTQPHLVIERTVQTLLAEFTAEREVFEDDPKKLFAWVERAAVSLFDFERISKLVLAKNWRQANDEQRAAFVAEFKKLLIGTYATALFKYTGDERVIFAGSKITERKGRRFAVVKSEVALTDGAPVAVDYALILDGDDWKIYNLTIGGINMVTNYRNTYAAAIKDLGLDGVLESMRVVNAKQW